MINEPRDAWRLGHHKQGQVDRRTYDQIEGIHHSPSRSKLEPAHTVETTSESACRQPGHTENTTHCYPITYEQADIRRPSYGFHSSAPSYRQLGTWISAILAGRFPRRPRGGGKTRTARQQENRIDILARLLLCRRKLSRKKS